MNIYQLIFGKQASFDEANAAPTYDALLMRRDFSAAIPMLKAAIAEKDARAMWAFMGRYMRQGMASRKIGRRHTAGSFKPPIAEISFPTGARCCSRVM